MIEDGRKNDSIFPLSAEQKRIWFLCQMGQEGNIWNIYNYKRVSGKLKLNLLCKAFQEVIRRHSLLRVTISEKKHYVYQTVQNDYYMDFKYYDLNHLKDSDREEYAKFIVMAETRRTFDLNKGPLIRFRVLRVYKNNYIILYCMHHIISDGLSIYLIWKDIIDIYNMYANGNKSNTKDMALQYSDYIQHQLSGNIYIKDKKIRKYWERQLRGEIEALRIPTDYARIAMQDIGGNTYRRILETEVDKQLKQFSLQNKVSLFTMLLTAFYVLLNRYTNQKDIIVGVPFNSRKNQRKFYNTVGFFVNVMPIRVNISDNLSFLDLLHRVNKKVNETYVNQDISFEELVQIANPNRSISHSPLYQIEFNMIRRPLLNMEFTELTEEAFPIIENNTAKNEMTFHISERLEGFEIGIEYRTKLFRPKTIERMMDHYLTLLNYILISPEKCISELQLLTEKEKRQICQWNQISLEHKCIHQLFEDQTDIAPDSIAVIYRDQKITYYELNKRANQLAYYLRSKGVGPEVIVGLCMNRSLDMIVGILGILKAGGAYAPFDPSIPTERLVMMLSNSHLDILLTQEYIIETNQLGNIQLIYIDADWNQISKNRNVCNPRNLTNKENLIYVMHTSGSSGIPKAVAVEHRQLFHYIHALTERTGLLQGLYYASVSTIAADLGNTVIFPSLVKGGCLHIIPQKTSIDPLAMEKYFQNNIVDILKIVPSHFIALLKNSKTRRILPQELLILGGEASYWRDIDEIRSIEPNLITMNHYGPTEATIGVSTYTTTSVQDLERYLTVPLGRPLSNSIVYILDKNHNLLPATIPGEIYIGGEQLTRGYYNRPDLTAERFIPNSYNESFMTRLYKTGDLGRYQPNGNLEYIGRIDGQVKIRGYRVELQEIEAVLLEYPSIKEVVITTYNRDGDYSIHIIAYIISEKKLILDIIEIKEYLKKKLPEYMIPSVFLLVDSIPITANGKIDYRRLPVPDMTYVQSEADSSIPRNHIEDLLMGIWAEVLKNDYINIRDDFFNIGDHSLLAIQAMSRIRELLQVELSLKTIFEKPTVEKMARHIETIMQKQLCQTWPEIKPMAREIRHPLSFAQERLWFIDRFKPDNCAYNISSAFRLRGKLNPNILEQSINEIIRRHESLRTLFKDKDGKAFQVISKFKHIQLEVYDLACIPCSQCIEQGGIIVDKYIKRPFNLALDTLFRAALVTIGSNDYYLVMTTHHIVWDGWSTENFINEVSSIYESYLNGRPSPLKELNIQYVDYVHWQHECFKSGVYQSQLAYWEKELAGSLPLLKLPTYTKRPPIQTYNGNAVTFAFNRDMTSKIKKKCQQLGCSLYMFIFSILGILLHRYSESEDIVVGTPFTSREHRDIEPLIGYFVDNVVMRISINGSMTYELLIEQIRKICLDAYTNSNVPFSKVIERIKPERDMSHTPLYQIMYAYNDDARQRLKLPGLKVNCLDIRSETAKYDLTLFILKTGEEITGAYEYNSDIFTRDTICRFSKHFNVLTEFVINNTRKPIKTVPLLTEKERHEIIEEWNSTEEEYDENICIHELFQSKAIGKPDSIAIVDREKYVTYSELNKQACRLSAILGSLGISRNSYVGVYVNRSIDMITTLIGIMKTGAAYVPLETNNPRDRIINILNQLDIECIITTTKHLDTIDNIVLEMMNVKNIVYIDSDADRKRYDDIYLRQKDNNINYIHLFSDSDISELSSNKQKQLCSPDNVAYVIFTSGSTGVPKGIAVQHKPVINLIKWVNKKFSVNERDKLLFITSIGFDLSVYDIFGILAAGATIRLVQEDDIQSPEDLLEIIQQENITYWDSAPAALQQLVPLIESLPKCISPSMRLVFLSGDWIPVPLFDILKEAFPNVKVIALGGATEATVWSNYYPIEKVELSWPSIPYGKPIQNAQYYILDKYLNVVPIGVIGDLYIGGECLSLGYLGQCAKTAEKYIPDPFSERPGKRLYRTDDRAKYFPDGNIEFLGRDDNQVKIRGFRIELGDIESGLREHPGVKDVIVVAEATTTREKRLVCYVVHDESLLQNVNELRDVLKEKVPNYMIPSIFIALDKIPMTSNGKIDRKALPPSESMRSDLGTRYIAPRDRTEEILSEIWADLLKLEKIGIDDNYFELGGDSIISIRIVAHAQKRGIHFNTRQLFQYQTIRQLRKKVNLQTEHLIKRHEKIVGLVPLAPIQRWFFEQEISEPHHFNQSFIFRLTKEVKIHLLRETISYLLLQHDMLRARYRLTKNSWQQSIDSERKNPLMIIDLSNLSLEDQDKTIKFNSANAQSKLNLANGVLIKIILYYLGEEKTNYLLFVLHHLIVDGVSWHIISEELNNNYKQLSQKGYYIIPSKSTSYKEWVCQLQKYCNSTKCIKNISYWTSQPWSEIKRIPTDYSKGDNTVGATNKITECLTPDETYTLLHKIPSKLSVQVQDVLLTALVESFHIWTGYKSLLLDIEGHGRELATDGIDLSRTVGWFTSIFPVIINIKKRDDIGTALIDVKEQFDKIPNNGFDYGIVKYMNRDIVLSKELNKIPNSEICFNYLGRYDNKHTKSDQFKLTTISTGSNQSPNQKRKYLLEINSMIVGGQLKITWKYSKEVHDYSTVSRLAKNCAEIIKQIVQYSEKVKSGKRKTSEFPDAKLSSNDIQKILAKLQTG